MKILGVDIGFGYTKATDGRRFQIFKSVIGEANQVQFAEALVPSAAESPRHFVVNGEEVFVGELAETQSRGRSFTLDPQQFLSGYAKTLALAALAPYAEHGDPIRLVTGLPISFFRRQRDALTSLLQNRHNVTIVHPVHGPEEKTVYIERVRVVPQPFGSLFSLMLDDDGKPANPRLLNEKIGVIDIGFRTTDFTIAERTRYSERGSASSDSGMATAYTTVANVLHENSGVNIELYRLYEAVTRGTIKIRGERYDLTKLVQHAYQQLATRIASEANRLWTDDWDLDAILVTGGGGATLAPYLQPLLKGEVLPVPAEFDPRVGNVLGYWKYGVHSWPA